MIPRDKHNTEKFSLLELIIKKLKNRNLLKLACCESQARFWHLMNCNKF